MEIMLELLKLGFVGVVAGLFSTYLANIRHRNQKWWELRVSAYQAVIEALSDINYYYGVEYSAVTENKDLNQKTKNELSEIWNKSYHRVRKAADSGVFLFSEEANSVLKKFINLKNIHHDSYFEYLDTNYTIAEKCLNAMLKAAKNDLKVRRFSYNHGV